MLNELYELKSSMQASGIAVQSWHKDYGTCPKNRTFRVLLDKDGAVIKIEPINDVEKIKSLRKWEVSNGTSFPAFNVLPLLHVASEEAISQVAILKKLLKSQSNIEKQAVTVSVEDLRSKCKQLWVKKEASRINDCLQAHPRKLSQIIGVVPQDFKALEEVIRRAGMIDAGKLENGIREAIVRNLVQTPVEAKDWIDTMLVSSAKIERGIKKISLVLEIADWSAFPYPANHGKIQEWINSRLMSSTTPTLINSHESYWDAFSQPLSEADLYVKFPDAELGGILGKVTLRAMSSESPCQVRYKRVDAESFPCGKQIRQEMKDSLEWLGNQSRKGKTWQDVSDACGYDKRAKGALFAYPSVLLDDPPEIAGLFVSEVDDHDGAKFESVAARVTPAIEGMVTKDPGAEIRVFILVKPDGYRTKVLVSRNFSAKQMILAASTWQDGCKNIPHISLNLGTRENPNLVMPRIPFPTGVVKCLNVSWLQTGARTKKVHGLGIGDGIKLLIETESGLQKVSSYALQLAISNTTPLLLALGHADHRKDGSFNWSKDTAKYAKHASLLPSVLGLLLYKLNYMKGGYMHNSTFLAGQMLSLADTLHQEYCQHVRKGEVPPQLIGNALMSIALNNPTAGIARLSERIILYQAWANTADGDKVGLAKWALQRFRNITEELSKQILPEQCNDADKAQMLLGYLASIQGNSPELGTN